MQFCRKCGTKMSDDAVFCSKCGCKVLNSEQHTVSLTKEEPLAKKVLADKNKLSEKFKVPYQTPPAVLTLSKIIKSKANMEIATAIGDMIVSVYFILLTFFKSYV